MADLHEGESYDDDDYEQDSKGPYDVSTEMHEWIKESGWFNRDKVLTEAAVELDGELVARGVPAGRRRYNLVEDSLRRRFPERFYDRPARKPAWSDIGDPEERRAARQALKEINHSLQYTGKKISQEQYLKSYLKG